MTSQIEEMRKLAQDICTPNCATAVELELATNCLLLIKALERCKNQRNSYCDDIYSEGNFEIKWDKELVEILKGDG